MLPEQTHNLEAAWWLIKSSDGEQLPWEVTRLTLGFIKQEISFTGLTAEISGFICNHSKAQTTLYFLL